ncbi:hypothetical protein SDC9_130720 [bioreactor metagenome]|uniref:Uncharacterized protein n=1 Tax=bioreactor metagenome TaxID=1076179 RepID=A0A645D3C7_9ZZZZ
MTGWMVLVTIFLFLAASAVGCYPGRQRTAMYLMAAAAVTMALTASASLILKENVFSDALVVPAALWLRAVIAIVVCAGLGLFLARLIGGKNR